MSKYDLKSNISYIGNVLILLLLMNTKILFAEINATSSFDQLKFESINNIKNKVTPILEQYCREKCQLIDVKVELTEAILDSEDLGFESVSEESTKDTFYVSKSSVKIQVDDRVTTENKDRLKNMMQNHLTSLGFPVEIQWLAVQIPQIGQLDTSVAALKKQLVSKLTGSINEVFATYCPNDCMLGNIEINGHYITGDQANDYASNEVFRSPTVQNLMKINDIQIEVEFNESLVKEEQSKILNVLRAKTKYVTPISFKENVSAFPEAFEIKSKKSEAEASDPYGLEKLRRMLVMFRDLAGTKEVLTTNNTTTSSNSNSSNTSASSKDVSTYTNSKEQALKESVNSSSTMATTQSSNSLESKLTDSQKGIGGEYWIDGVPNWVTMLSAIAFLFMIVGAVLLRFMGAKKDAEYMMQAMNMPHGKEFSHGNESNQNNGLSSKKDDGRFDSKDITLRLKNEELKKELIDIFMKNPKVAKETFARMIQEEGVEETSKYVHIFGHMIVFELLGDPHLSRELYELSEFYHKSAFNFSLQDEHSLLLALRTKVTANEIKVLTRKTTDQFDFILKLDSTQTYNLIADEKPSVQSIVLTQLDHKRRRGVFDLFEGEKKVNLMKELCLAEAIPKEYLSSVARALHKKVLAKPEFDAENLRSGDILLELLEKANINEQRALMKNLNETNKSAARLIKLKLVTLEILPYLKGGMLIEIVLGLATEEIVTFLAGTQDHIRKLLLSNASEELAESWVEELNQINSIDEGRYQLVEMKILGRLRTMAANGAINLLEINELIFGDKTYEKVEVVAEQVSGIRSTHLVA